MSFPLQEWASLQNSLDQTDCDCGAANATRAHTISPGNPTGHAVDCPVYLRWQEEVKLQTKDDNGASNANTAGRNHGDARRP